MPLLVAPLFSLFVGTLFAWLARDGAAPDRVRERRALYVAAAFAAFVLCPVLSWFVAFHGDWAYLYFLPSLRIPSAVDTILVAATVLLLPGTTLVLGTGRRFSSDAIPRALVGTATAFVLAFGLAWGRISVSATYAQFHGNFGRTRIAGTPLGYTFVAAIVVLALGIVYGARIVRPQFDAILSALFRRGRAR